MQTKIQTFTGKLVDPLKMSMYDIDIRDIAHALSMICRFGGHTNRFYSVAEHSVYVSNLLPDYLKLAGLLHDGAEGLGLLDFPKPVKIQFNEYNIVEKGLQTLVYTKYLKYLLLDLDKVIIKKADKEVMKYEVFELMPDPFVYADFLGFDKNNYDIELDLNYIYIKCLVPEQAERLFLETFERLNK